MCITVAVRRPACYSCGFRAHAKFTGRGLFACFTTATRTGPLTARRPPDSTKRTQLPDKPARTRFAPSPTGYLHLGSLRTALYNYLLARATDGQFILRLEDTDQSRIVLDAETRLYDDLRWSGILWDEGPDRGGPYGPYKQSERLDIYRQHADRLLHEGKAFRCFCSQNDMAAHQHKTLEAGGAFGSYPGICLSIPAHESDERAARGEAHTVRFRSRPSPATVRDIVYGQYKKKLPEDHFIIMKSDGFPTYHFANVVDDHLMRITHVIRGAEWLISTAKHVSLYDAFGWEPPKFAHVGLLVDSNRQKLSKRNMDIGIDSYRRDKIPPVALLNFSALLGWNPTKSKSKGVMSLDEMVNDFGLKFTKGDIVVNEEKLGFLHKKHIQLALKNPSSSNNQLIDEYITKPVLKVACETEHERQQWLAGDMQGKLADGSFIASIGEPVLQLPRPDTTLSDSKSLDLMRTALRICRIEALNPPDLVEAIRYLIWQPPRAYIEERFSGLLPSAASLSMDGVSVSTAGALRSSMDQLGHIDDTVWSADTIHGVLNAFTKSVIYRDPEDQPVVAGYKLLRWALLGLNDGPQISHLMEYLGKTETLRRLQEAESVATYLDHT